MPDRSLSRLAVLRGAPPRARGEARAPGRATLAGLTRDADVDAHLPRRWCGALGEAGLLRHACPPLTAARDERLDVRALCLVRETLARFATPGRLRLRDAGPRAAARSRLFGSEEQRRTLPARRRARRQIAAFALSEPAAGSDVAAIATTRRRDGDDFVLNGAKTWISNGGIADFYVRVRAHRRGAGRARASRPSSSTRTRRASRRRAHRR